MCELITLKSPEEPSLNCVYERRIYLTREELIAIY